MAVVVTLVAAAVVSVGLTEFYFSYQDSVGAATSLEADKASAAAVSIQQFMREIVGDLQTVSKASAAPDGLDRLQSFQGLLTHQTLISALPYLDARGRDCVRA